MLEKMFGLGLRPKIEFFRTKNENFGQINQNFEQIF